MSKSGKPWHRHFETIGSISAIVVGVAALIVAWDQGRVMRAQQHGAVMPAIQMNFFQNETNGVLRVGMRLRNNGVGPATIEGFSIQAAGQDLTSWNDFIAISPPTRARNWSSIQGRILGPGEEITAIELSWTESDPVEPSELTDYLIHMSQTAQAEICYCSVFDRCFVSRTSPAGHVPPEQVRQCEPSPWSDDINVLGPDFIDASNEAEPAIENTP